MLEVLGPIAVTAALTRTRMIPHVAARAPERAIAARETLALAGCGITGPGLIKTVLTVRTGNAWGALVGPTTSSRPARSPAPH